MGGISFFCCVVPCIDRDLAIFRFSFLFSALEFRIRAHSFGVFFVWAHLVGRDLDLEASQFALFLGLRPDLSGLLG